MKQIKNKISFIERNSHLAVIDLDDILKFKAVTDYI
jgi:hypothetical protein